MLYTSNEGLPIETPMDASAAVSSRLIGAIFVEKGLVTPDQLERAMQIQAETGDRLGEVFTDARRWRERLKSQQP